MNCPICYEKLTHGSSTTTACNHCFHESCLDLWFLCSGTCPMCRNQLTSRPQSPTSVLEFHTFFEPNLNLGQLLDYGTGEL